MEEKKQTAPEPVQTVPDQTDRSKQKIQAKIKEKLRSKEVWVVLVLFLLFFSLCGFVPVGKIPFLRNIAYAMGYSAEEAAKISMLKALLSWKEHQAIMRGDKADPDAVMVFGGNYGTNPRQDSSARLSSALINMREVNASLKKKGLPADRFGRIGGIDNGVDAENHSPVNIKNTAVSAATQANAQTPQDIYFGTDASLIARDPKDGFNSVNMLKKVANPNITGGGSTDWFMSAVDKATLTDPKLDGLSKELSAGNHLSQLAPITDIGRRKAQRDMYYAWLTGMSARRVPNVILKKTLASAGFSGAEMPKRVFESNGFSGVGIHPDDVVADLDNIKLRLKNEEACEKATAESNLNEQLTDATQKVNSLAGKFPSSCGSINSGFIDQMNSLSASCTAIKKSYDNLTPCGLHVSPSRSGSPDCAPPANLVARYDAFVNYCNEEMKKCNDLATVEEQNECKTHVSESKSADYDQADCAGGACSEQGLRDEIAGIYNVPVEGTSKENTSAYFPEPDWGSFTFL